MIAVVGHRARGAISLRKLKIGGLATSDLMAIVLENGRQMIGVGHDGHRLRIWGP